MFSKSLFSKTTALAIGCLLASIPMESADASSQFCRPIYANLWGEVWTEHPSEFIGSISKECQGYLSIDTFGNVYCGDSMILVGKTGKFSPAEGRICKEYSGGFFIIDPNFSFEVDLSNVIEMK